MLLSSELTGGSCCSVDFYCAVTLYTFLTLFHQSYCIHAIVDFGSHAPLYTIALCVHYSYKVVSMAIYIHINTHVPTDAFVAGV